jgi:hypothetical protein
VLPPADKERVAQALEEDAQVMSNTQLTEQLAGQPEDVRAEVVRINTEVRPRALQVALMIPFLAALLGLVLSFKMSRTPVLTPTRSVEGLDL